jgi:carbonyl reductase 1
MEQPKLAVVTGANRGIGLEVSKQLLRRGIQVVLTSRDVAAGRAATQELKAQGLPAHYHPLDVTDAASTQQLAAWLTREHGGADILINNAGAMMRAFNLEVVRSTLAVNFYGAVQVTDALLPCLRPGGRLVFVSSSLGNRTSLAEPAAARFAHALDRAATVALMDKFVADVAADRLDAEGWPRSAYVVSKIGITMFAGVLARELGSRKDPRGLLVNACCPGWVQTRMGGASAPRSIEEGADTPVWLALLPAGGPTGGFFRDRAPAEW